MGDAGGERLSGGRPRLDAVEITARARGLFLTTWMHVLPPLPAPLWQALRAHVASALASPPAP